MPSLRRRPTAIGSRLQAKRAAEPLCSAEFLRCLSREAARAERTSEVLSLLLLDLEWSPPERLEEFCRFLQSRLRLTDEVGWLDGCHFGILMPSTDSAQAAVVAESVQAALDGAGLDCAWRLMSSDRDQELWNLGAEPVRREEEWRPDDDDEQPPYGAESDGTARRRFRLRDRALRGDRAALRPEPLAPLMMVRLPFGKRVLDVCGALALLILLSPVLLLTALAVRLESRGPVIFRQRRVGQGGRVFDLLKFRTMVVNAEALLPQLAKENLRDGPAFKLRHDPRITRIGRWLRALSIDELPQLWNVLKGDMSLVGPRPALPSEVRQYEPWQRARLSMVGGLTCYWQVDGRLRNVSFDDWVRQDLRYRGRSSARTDLGLMARTAWVVLAKRTDA